MVFCKYTKFEKKNRIYTWQCPEFESFSTKFNPCIFDSLSIPICDSIIICIKKVTTLGKEMSKLAKKKRQTNQTEKQKKNIIFDRVL